MNRQEFRDRVVEAVSGFQEVELRGSFAHDDFHLNVWDGVSRSDVDLVGLGASESRREALIRDVARAVKAGTGLPLKVSIHPERSFEDLRPDDARFLALGEYIRHERCPEAGVGDFLRAKIALLALRAVPQERYRAVGERVGGAARQALAVKLGDAADFSVGTARALLALSPLPEAQRLAVLMSDDEVALRTAYKQELLDRRTVSLWLRRYIAGTLPC